MFCFHLYVPKSIAHSSLITAGNVLHQNSICYSQRVDSSSYHKQNEEQLTLAFTKQFMGDEDNGLRYVSEKKEPLGDFIPPSDFPVDWFICPPPSNDEGTSMYKNSQLWGWRTNLERAIKKMDEAKVVEITNARSIEEVREFCEIRALLNKFTERGMKDSCRLLLDHCHVSVEGVQDACKNDNWSMYINMKNKGKGYGSNHHHGRSPLMIAAHDGYYEICKLLLDHSSSVKAIDHKTGGNALSLALSQGHKDIVRLFCKTDASVIAHKDFQGNDCIDTAEEFCAHENCNTRLYEKILEILREYDDRCSHCKAKPAVLYSCPCGKERYCNSICQKKRWKKHKWLHTKVMEKAIQKTE